MLIYGFLVGVQVDRIKLAGHSLVKSFWYWDNEADDGPQVGPCQSLHSYLKSNGQE